MWDKIYEFCKARCNIFEPMFVRVFVLLFHNRLSFSTRKGTNAVCKAHLKGFSAEWGVASCRPAGVVLDKRQNSFSVRSVFPVHFAHCCRTAVIHQFTAGPARCWTSYIIRVLVFQLRLRLSGTVNSIQLFQDIKSIDGCQRREAAAV